MAVRNRSLALSRARAPVISPRRLCSQTARVHSNITYVHNTRVHVYVNAPAMYRAQLACTFSRTYKCQSAVRLSYYACIRRRMSADTRGQDRPCTCDLWRNCKNTGRMITEMTGVTTARLDDGIEYRLETLNFYASPAIYFSQRIPPTYLFATKADGEQQSLF